MITDRMVDAFTGKSSELRVKIKGVKHHIFIFFGGIRIPTAAVDKRVNMKEVGETCYCSIEDKGGFYEVTPNVVRMIIQEEGYLGSYNERHVKALEEWLRKNFANVLKEVILA